jgi:hypothetical protein
MGEMQNMDDEMRVGRMDAITHDLETFGLPEHNIPYILHSCIALPWMLVESV